MKYINETETDKTDFALKKLIILQGQKKKKVTFKVLMYVPGEYYLINSKCFGNPR